MKKLIALLLAAAMLIGFTGCSGEKKTDFDPEKEFGTNVLYVYNAGEYIDPQVIKDFEAKYNVSIKYSLFASNEEMYTKLMTGASYDVIIPSDYMIERLIKENMLQPIDKSIVTNLKNLTPFVTNLEFDPTNTYAVPYLWGSVGILYDSSVIDTSEVEEKGYSIFLDPQYKGDVFMYDSERDAFMIAFKALGYSMNTSNEDEINAAFEWLKKMDEAVAPSYVTDEVIDSMIDGEKKLALVYSGDAAYINAENEDMLYCEPKEGTNIWIDAMIIPANAPCPKLANTFINFILEYENSKAISEFVGYTSSNDQVLKELSSEGGAFEGIAAYTPRENYDKDEFFHSNDILKEKLSELWNKVKLHER